MGVSIRGQVDVRGRRPSESAARRARVCAHRRDPLRCVHREPGREVYRTGIIRPNQLDPAIVPLFPVPNFPSYPSNHSTFSASRSEILAYLFPTRAVLARAIGKEAGDSRIWAGIHYQMDNVAGVNLGHSVAAVFIARAQQDGSQ